MNKQTREGSNNMRIHHLILILRALRCTSPIQLTNHTIHPKVGSSRQLLFLSFEGSDNMRIHHLILILRALRCTSPIQLTNHTIHPKVGSSRQLLFLFLADSDLRKILNLSNREQPINLTFHPKPTCEI